jgi:hypothetical protein
LDVVVIIQLTERPQSPRNSISLEGLRVRQVLGDELVGYLLGTTLVQRLQEVGFLLLKARVIEEGLLDACVELPEECTYLLDYFLLSRRQSLGFQVGVPFQ